MNLMNILGNGKDGANKADLGRVRFERFWPQLIKWEGTRYEHDPDDPGGATKFGIDQRSHPKVDIRNLTEAAAKEIYWQEYWMRNGIGELPCPLGEVHFDTCVNTGAGQAKKFLVRSRNAAEYLELRDDFYRGLAARRPRMKKFLKGWLNRTADLRRWASIV